MSPSPSAPLGPLVLSRLSGWLSHLGVSPWAFDDTLSLLTPLLTVHRQHARIVEVRRETPSAVTLVLQAGAAFHEFKPGQFVRIGVTIDGRRHVRAYSPRSVPTHPRRFAITVQRQPHGRVSEHLNVQARRGDILEIDQAEGVFTLGATTPPRLLLIAGGSGITPCMAMLEHLERQVPSTLVTLLYFARSAQDRIFAQELKEMSRRWAALNYLPVNSGAHTPTTDIGAAPSAQPVLDAALLKRAAPDWSQLPTWCCGPAPLMGAARQLWAGVGASARLHLEAFAAPPPSTDDHAVHQVSYVRDRHVKQFSAPGSLPLLQAGEEAGLALKHGCRQGICHECTCRLKAGSVRDLISGERIDGQGQPIRVCVSTPMSDLQLESLN